MALISVTKTSAHYGIHFCDKEHSSLWYSFPAAVVPTIVIMSSKDQDQLRTIRKTNRGTTVSASAIMTTDLDSPSTTYLPHHLHADGSECDPSMRANLPDSDPNMF